jgi:hypothetical protein
MNAMLQMQKLDIETLRHACEETWLWEK